MKNFTKYRILIFLILIFRTEMIYAIPKDDESSQDSSSGILSKDNVVFGLKTAAVAGATIVGAPYILGAAGFSAAGVTAGSLAAYYQSTMLGGYVASSSIFAGLQSLGAAGLGFGTKAAVAAVSGFGVKFYDIFYGTTNVYKDTRGCSKDSPQKCSELTKK